MANLGKEVNGERAKGRVAKEKDILAEKGTKATDRQAKQLAKDLIIWGEDEYIAAWGGDTEYHNYEYDDWDYGYGETHYVGNQMMLLENSCTNTCVNSKNSDGMHTTTNHSLSTTITKQVNAVSGKRDPLKGTECAEAVSIHNRYAALTNDDDDDNSDNDHNHNNDDDSEDGDNWRLVERKKANLNKRQRAQEKSKYPTTKE